MSKWVRVSKHLAIYKSWKSIEVYVGPWVGRIIWGGGRFGWLEGQGPIIRFIRRWWSGWHRWDDDLPY